MNKPVLRVRRPRRLWLWITLALIASGSELRSAERAIEVRFSPTVHDRPFTGRVYVFFSRTKVQEPRLGPDWFFPEPFIARDVKEWKPGEPLVFSNELSDEVLGFPVPFAKMSIERNRAQAVVRFNPLAREVGVGPGNGFSAPITLAKPKEGQPPQERVTLLVDQKVVERPFPEERWCKLLRVKSAMLSKFHGRDVYLQGAVTLPASYFKETNRRYPTIFNIPGFGGTHRQGYSSSPVEERNPSGVEFLRVVLDPSCPLGHHVFADSDNNGPVGTAFVEEFLPEFDKQYRSVADPRARFLTGHSSGGWGSLWLQVSQPDHFGGTWSTAPDPVDFRDFQRIDLYAPNQNMYVDPAGKARPLARHGDEVLLTYRNFADMEWVLGPGGQLHSFEAVFSRRGSDGRPALLWDRKTGAVNPEVAKSWERYDIRLVLERNWKTLGSKLAGKLHIHTGSIDTFYLEGAVALLKKSLEQLGSDAVVEIHPGEDHSSLMTPMLMHQITSEMAARFAVAFPDQVKKPAVKESKVKVK
ncbi:MAG: alpha/beta hydrolase-fold protein [Planctomycetaceae bacterium]